MINDWLDNKPDRNPLDVSIWDLFDRDLFVQMRKEGYIRVQTLDNSVLAIANYTEKAQYEQKWNPVTLQCRGLIFDIFTHNVVARPFPKFFNWDDSSQPYPPQSQCVLMPKMDGSLGVLYYHDDGYKIATRGSFVSDQAVHATKRLREIAAEWQPVFHVEATYLFEIIYPMNRIVVDYGEKDTLVLLDVIETKTGVSRFDLFDELRWPEKVSRKSVVFNDSLIHDIPKGEEGFVMYWPYQNMRVKMKSAEYLHAHRIVTNLTPKNIWRAVVEDRLQEIRDIIPDEWYSWFNDQVNGLHQQFESRRSSARDRYRAIKSKLPAHPSRKEFAALATQDESPAEMFCIFDARWDQLATKIWKDLEPKGTDGLSR